MLRQKNNYIPDDDICLDCNTGYTTLVFKSQLKKNWPLIVLTIVGFLLRFIGQPKLPYGFHRDEAGIAYSAYSVLKTGKDEWGRFLPLHFKALGDYPPGIYNYLVVGSIFFLGLTELAERLPAILFGVAFIPLSYLFVVDFFKNKQLGLWTAFLITFNTWMIVQSRAGSEALVALTFSIAGFLCFKKFIEAKKSIKYAIWTLLAYFLALYSYNATRLALPLLHAAVLYYLWPQIKPARRKLNLILAGLLLVFAVFSTLINANRSMSFNDNSIFSIPENQQSLQVIYNREGSHGFSPFLIRIFSNKYINWTTTFIRQYFDYFDYEFLFSDRGLHARYLVPKVGPLLWWTIPFLLIGIFANRFGRRQKALLLLWILIAPLPAAITAVDVPNLKRAMYLFFPLLILAAAGLQRVQVELIKRKISIILSMIILPLFLWNLGFFAKQYVIHTKYETTQHRSYGYKEMFALTENYKNDYNQIYVYENIDTPHTFYLFYTKYPPELYQKIPNNGKRDLFLLNKPTVKINQYVFHPGSCPTVDDLPSHTLYVFPVGCNNDIDFAHQFVVKKIINSIDGSLLFYLSDLKN